MLNVQRLLLPLLRQLTDATDQHGLQLLHRVQSCAQSETGAAQRRPSAPGLEINPQVATDVVQTGLGHTLRAYGVDVQELMVTITDALLQRRGRRELEQRQGSALPLEETHTGRSNALTFAMETADAMAKELAARRFAGLHSLASIPEARCLTWLCGSVASLLVRSEGTAMPTSRRSWLGLTNLCDLVDVLLRKIAQTAAVPYRLETAWTQWLQDLGANRQPSHPKAQLGLVQAVTGVRDAGAWWDTVRGHCDRFRFSPGAATSTDVPAAIPQAAHLLVRDRVRMYAPIYSLHFANAWCVVMCVQCGALLQVLHELSLPRPPHGAAWTSWENVYNVAVLRVTRPRPAGGGAQSKPDSSLFGWATLDWLLPSDDVSVCCTSTEYVPVNNHSAEMAVVLYNAWRDSRAQERLSSLRLSAHTELVQRLTAVCRRRLSVVLSALERLEEVGDMRREVVTEASAALGELDPGAVEWIHDWDDIASDQSEDGSDRAVVDGRMGYTALLEQLGVGGCMWHDTGGHRSMFDGGSDPAAMDGSPTSWHNELFIDKIAPWGAAIQQIVATSQPVRLRYYAENDPALLQAFRCADVAQPAGVSAIEDPDQALQRARQLGAHVPHVLALVSKLSAVVNNVLGGAGRMEALTGTVADLRALAEVAQVLVRLSVCTG